MAFAVNVKGGTCGGDKVSCTHCGKLGHEEASCFQLVEYPSGWNSREGRNGHGRGRNSRDGRSTGSRGRGTCAAKERQANAACILEGSNTGRNEGELDRSLLSKITDDQVQKLLSLIEAPKDTHEKLSDKYDWLLDTGASYHMTRNINLLQSVCDMNPIPIGMSNGAIALASKHGSVKLNKKLILSDALCVSSLNCNLISITRLINDLFCNVTFTPRLCAI